MMEVSVNYCYSRVVFFISILLKCGLIRQQIICGDTTTIIVYDKWKSFIAEYELDDVEIINSKVDVLV